MKIHNKKCENCGEPVQFTTEQLYKRVYLTCSTKCTNDLKYEANRVKVKCYICNKEFNYKKSHYIKLKDPDRVTCSRSCSAKNRSEYMQGEGNHQHGLTGELNSSFIPGDLVGDSGYVSSIAPSNHPRAKSGRFLKHILVMEEKIGRYLKYYGKSHGDNEIVHHIDRNKLNNHIDNLILMTMASHLSLHNTEDKERHVKGMNTQKMFDECGVSKIRKMYKNKRITQSEIANMYGVSQSVISSIIIGSKKCYMD